MTSQQLHPLRLAYVCVVRKMYNDYIQGDRNPCKTEAAARKVSGLGLDYNTYVELAMKILQPTAQYYRWPYPYWNAVISDKTIERVRKLAKLTPVTVINNDNLDAEEELFEAELSYAVDYVEWWFGRLACKPSRCDDVVIAPAIKTRVVQYLSRMWGVPCTSSSYNVLCKALEANEH